MESKALALGKQLKIAERGTFEAMKKDAVGTIEQKKATRYGTSFYRKGVVGDWRNHFFDEQLEKFNRWCNSHLEGTGLEFYLG